MALLYPWATKEYLLWEMTIGQIVLYHNLGIEMKYPSEKPEGGGQSLKDLGPEAAKKIRDELRALKAQRGESATDASKEQYRRKYGDI